MKFEKQAGVSKPQYPGVKKRKVVVVDASPKNSGAGRDMESSVHSSRMRPLTNRSSMDWWMSISR